MSKKNPVEGVRGFIAEWSVTILMLLFGTTTLVQAFVVPTGSMESTVLIGDHVFVDKLAYSPPGSISKYLLPYSDVKRGDIVVFRYPIDIRENYVKRVIGVPGDRIRIENKQVILNGKPLDEPYKVHVREFSVPYLDNFPDRPDFPVYEPARKMLSENVENGELVVPPGNYFCMGDNRDNSADSRFWGFVPRENIVGKPVIIWWSYDAPTSRLADPNIISLDHIIDLAQNFFTKTRWDRTFRLVRGHPIQ
jgi:signal peptidase I